MLDQSRPVLIVNADDFGLSRMINGGIETAHRKGILTSASLMAVGPDFDYAIEIARRNPKLGIGIHLTLVEEKPLSSSGAIASLLDESGNFHGSAKRLGLLYLRRRIDLAQVRLELQRQFEKVLDSGLRITHVDSHQHTHLLPGVHKVVSELARTYGVSCIRRTNEPLSVSSVYRHSINPARLIELGLIRGLNYLTRGSPLRSTDEFAGFIHGGQLNEARLLSIVEQLSPGRSVELMCHPGDGKPDRDKAHWGYQWETELQALTSLRVQQAIEQSEVQLLNWEGLQQL
ncbi:MAG: ChbG/HpnK family deacetylase [Granulosicoccus sp.]|nr:ChbG/HpnK family deacetylase [Granulosicoccus sp.]